MKVSVLTATYNRCEDIEKLYNSLVVNKNSGVDFEWLIMDDGSTDKTKLVVDGFLKQVVPEFERLRGQYETLWQMGNNDGYLKLVGVMQKFIDQAISANTSYDPKRFEGGRVPMNQMLKDLLSAYKYGVKTLYYHNTRDGADDMQTDLQDEDCVGGACKI